MVFTKEDGILIKVLRQSKGYSSRKLLEEFPDKDWSCSALDRLLRQIDTTAGSADRSLAAAENVRSAQETCLWHVCANGDHYEHKLTDGIAYELVRRLFHIGNFCFWVPFFKQLLPKNCTVDFVEICNVCTRKAIIKAAKMILNSDKICRSYCDFYIGVTFLKHTVYKYIDLKNNLSTYPAKAIIPVESARHKPTWPHHVLSRAETQTSWRHCEWREQPLCVVSLLAAAPHLHI